MASLDEQALPGIGDTLGSLRLVELLGEGGMGVVYRAQHLRLPRQAVIKILKPQLARSLDEVQRFFEEARAVNEIGHRNIVDVVDFVAEREHSPPLVYMVMESLDGEDLASYLRKNGPLPAPEVLEITLPLLEALEAAHRVGIVHRDLKPENVFLHHSAEGRVVKLLDFGVAKAFGNRAASGLTSPGITLGTPRYMAPEQVRSKPLDARTDLYALGLMLYEMLAGKPPFEAEDLTEVMLMQARSTPPPLPRDPQRPLSVSLESAVLRCLEKKPGARYQSAEDLRDALVRCPEGREATEPTPPPVRVSAAHEELSETARTKRNFWLGLGAASVLTAALLVIAVVLLVRGGDPPPQQADLGVRTARAPTLPAATAKVDAAAALLRGLTVVSKPAGAKVLIDGKRVGRTPLRDTSIRTRAVELQLVLSGYALHKETVPAGERKLHRSIALRRLRRRPRGSGTVLLTARLEGESVWAHVYVDGKRRKQQTPTRLKLAAGRHTIEVKREGRRGKRTILVRPRARISLPIDLR
jgi:tRNA A-37 threonylcarbamoyl transferase component Bud32